MENNLQPSSMFSIPNHILLSYQILSARREAQDSLVWQTPLLSLTAQSFLFGAAFQPNQSHEARYATMLLAFAIAIISMQLMIKHRYLELTDSLLLENMERRYGLQILHKRAADRAADVRLRWPWYVNVSSYRIWMIGLSIFAVMAIWVFALTWFDSYSQARTQKPLEGHVRLIISRGI